MKKILRQILSCKNKIQEMYACSGVSAMDCIGYLFITLGAQVCAWGVYSVVRYELQEYVNLNRDTLSAPLVLLTQHLWFQFLILQFPVFLLIPRLIVSIFTKNAGYHHYKKTNDSYFWLKSGLLYMMPGEIIRFLLCLLPIRIGLLTSLPFGAAFSGFSLLLFEYTYLNWTGRSAAIQLQQYCPADFLVYIPIHLIVLTVFLTVSLLWYRRSWLRWETEFSQPVPHNKSF